MKKVLFVILLSAITSIVVRGQESYTLTNETPVVVRTLLPASSNDSGVEIKGEIVEDVYSNDGGAVLIRCGTPVNIHAACTKSGAMGKPGKITIHGATTTSVDGQQISLKTDVVEVKGKGKGGLAHGLAWGLALPTSFCSCFFLLLEGGQAEIPIGTELPNCSVKGTYSVKLQK